MDDDYTFDIPEMNRIDSMMDDLLSDDDIPERSTKKNSGPNKGRPHGIGQTNRLYGSSFSSFAEQLNWSNAERFLSPFAQTKKPVQRLGGLTLAVYSEAINWTNAINAHPLVGIAETSRANVPDTLESFFDNFADE